MISAQQFQMCITLPLCYHHCGFWGLIAIDGYTTPYAHLAWLNGDRSIFEQVELFPCHDCCTIAHVQKKPRWGQNGGTDLSQEEEEELMATDRFGEDIRGSSSRAGTRSHEQTARTNPFLEGVDQFLRPIFGHRFR